MGFNARLDRIAHMEQLFAHAPMRSLGPLSVQRQGFNGVPNLVELLDESTGSWVRAVNKPASAQLPQETFAWRAIREFDAEDLFAVTVPRADAREGYVIEHVAGSRPLGLADAVQGLKIRHADAELPGHEARVDLHRMLGVDWLLANADRHEYQMAISPTGLLGFDQGHLGWRLTKTGDDLVVPMHDALLGTAGTRAQLHRPGHLELEPAAVDMLLDDARPDAIAYAHSQTIAAWRGPVHPDFARTSAFAASPEYLSGVLTRMEHLADTGTIHFVNARTLV